MASLWLVGLGVAVTGLYLGSSAGHTWRLARYSGDIVAARRKHRSAIRGAEKKLRRLQKGRSKGIAKAHKRLHQLETPYGTHLATYRGVQLHELGIVCRQGRTNLEGAHATVDATGNVAVTQRATLTRMGAGALVAGPVGLVAVGVAGKKKKKHDFRELYLTIQTSSFSTVIKCNPNEGLKARNFAARVNGAAQEAPGIRARRPHEVAAARAVLESAESPTGPTDAARAELERVRSDPSLLGAIEAARGRLALESGSSPAPT